ncbi:glycoside hydrolase family 2 protein [Penicillium malachiteum]|uniref:Glycoside hydrolase family 2 protein n=1 Tax=Penicillium malachiteum TaxID=1324776 RepID=A0AAD6HTW4_9EURO|nr:glycoside hydrolase family 2 protein [Penicillium malachiteum]
MSLVVLISLPVSHLSSFLTRSPWAGEKYFIRVDAATNHGRVFVDSQFVTKHSGGYTSFEADITHLVAAGKEFRLTIAQYDFYNYAGLARSVWLFSVPKTHIQDITIVTDVADTTGIVDYQVTTNESFSVEQFRVSVIDEEGKVMAQANGQQNRLQVDSTHLWQPGAAYLYQLEVELLSSRDSQMVLDIYSIATGIRSVRVSGMQFLINNKSFYFTGFGKHEDTAIPNSFRGSHYPYAEEVFDYAERHGIVVIDETAAVGLNMAIVEGILGKKAPPTFSSDTINDRTQSAHKQAIRELISRDKKHPCVVLWMIANEPASGEVGATEYFEPLVKLTRELSPSRPVCFANMASNPVNRDLISGMFDVVSLNRYFGWYRNTGQLDMAEDALHEELSGWQEKYGNPIINVIPA